MSNSVLDNFDEVSVPIESKKSIRKLLWGFACYAVVIIINISWRNVSGFRELEVISIITLILVLTAFVMTLLGLINGIRAFMKKEKTAKKYIGLLGNFILVLIVGLIVFANVFDIYVSLTR